MKLILGLIAPSDGAVKVFDGDPATTGAAGLREGLGFLPENVAFHGAMTGRELLRFYARLKRAPGAEVDSLLDRVGLAAAGGRRVSTYSKGMRQRLGLAQALLADHSLLILDEPTHGLDPLWTQRFRDVVREERRPGRVIVVASHNLDELERVADRVAILHRGRLERVATPGAGPTGGWYRLRIAAPHPALTAAFPAAEPVGGSGTEVRIHGDAAALSAGLRALLEAGAVVEAWYPERSRLEAAFREAVGER